MLKYSVSEQCGLCIINILMHYKVINLINTKFRILGSERLNICTVHLRLRWKGKLTLAFVSLAKT